MVLRHTMGAPAAIQEASPPQSRWQRLLVKAYELYVEAPNDTNPPTFGRTGNVIYYSFDPNTLNECFGKFPVPTDWIAGTDMFAYPVFSMDQNWLGKVRWGIAYTAEVKGMSIAAVPIVQESSIDADGTGAVLPPKSQWLTLSDIKVGVPKEDVFQRGDFTTLAHVEFRWYRDGLSALDNHGANARLYGIVIMYQAFI